MKKNFIVAFLGPDGSGKSTLINYLTNYLRKKNNLQIYTFETKDI